MLSAGACSCKCSDVPYQHQLCAPHLLSAGSAPSLGVLGSTVFRRLGPTRSWCWLVRRQPSKTPHGQKRSHAAVQRRAPAAGHLCDCWRDTWNGSVHFLHIWCSHTTDLWAPSAWPTCLASWTPAWWWWCFPALMHEFIPSWNYGWIACCAKTGYA